MEKIKIDMKPIEKESVPVQVGDGRTFMLLRFIPCEEKEAFALEYAQLVMNVNEKLGICLKSYNEEMVQLYLIAKYYTDIDVEEVAPQTVCDFLLSSPGAIRLIEKEAGEDFEFAKRMGERLIESCRVTYESEHGLAKRIKDLLSTDVDTNNAETRELIEKLIDMKGALMEKEENEKILQFGKRKAAKTIKAGGAKINLAKKS